MVTGSIVNGHQQSYVSKGKSWNQNFDEQRFSCDLRDKIYNPARRRTFTSPDGAVLGKTVTTLIGAFFTTPAPFMGEYIADLVNKDGIDAIAQIFINGLKAPSVYNVLNKPNFTSDEIAAAAIKIVGNYPSDLSGIYA